MSAIEYALLAVMAARCGDGAIADDHISRAQQQTRAAARRQRQIVQIAALVVADDRARAAGLVLEHIVVFPQDAELLARIAPTETDDPVHATGAAPGDRGLAPARRADEAHK